MKLLWFVIATCMCLGSCFGRFSSDLKTVVDADRKVTADVTTRIVGPNVYCVTVSDTGYYNGVPVIAAPCSSLASEVTQLWTFGSDGTVRSNGKCLTPYADTSGAYIMIYNCPSPLKDIAKWKLDDEGKLASPSGLVLTYNGTGLILEIDVSSSYQTWWLLSNYTKPRMLKLAGLSNECMTLSGSSEVLLKNCDISSSAQKWYEYPDGTIRPESNIDRCVSYDDPYNARVVVTACGLNPSSERWSYRYDLGSLFYNERARLALERTQDNKIRAYPPSGKENQEWHRRFISST